MKKNQGLIVGERWEVIADGNYAISDHGRLMRTSRGKDGQSGFILGKRTNGKYQVGVICIQSAKKYVFIHKIVAEIFIGTRPDGCEVNHKDGNRENNHWLNLEYATPIENTRHSLHSGLKKCKLTELDVSEIRRKLLLGMCRAEIGRQHGCSGTHVSRIASGKSRAIKWKNQ